MLILLVFSWLHCIDPIVYADIYPIQSIATGQELNTKIKSHWSHNANLEENSHKIYSAPVNSNVEWNKQNLHAFCLISFLFRFSVFNNCNPSRFSVVSLSIYLYKFLYTKHLKHTKQNPYRNYNVASSTDCCLVILLFPHSLLSS